MNQSLDQFSQTATNWRKTIAKNNRRTRFVIALFFLMYIGIGLLVDTYIYAGTFRGASLTDIFFGLITFQLFPLATVIMFVVALISIFVSFAYHDQLMLLGTEYREITPQTAQTLVEKQLYNVVEELKIAAGLRFMPKVYLIEADYMNAFASGYSEKSAMVAITRGLLEKLNRAEIQAVMAHELSHIRHMDIKLTLMASLLANMTLIVLDMIFYNAVFSNRNGENNKGRNALFAIIMILRYLMPVINILLILYLSRTREYMADAGSVQLLRDNQAMASALLKIQQDHEENKTRYTAAYQHTPHENVRRESYIFDPTQAGIATTSSFADLFSTHPSIDKRLAALGFKYVNRK